MIKVCDILTNSVVCSYKTVEECAKYEYLDEKILRNELEYTGYYSPDADTVYVSKPMNKPLRVLIFGDDEIKSYPSINNAMMGEEGLSYSDVKRGITKSGKKIEVMRYHD